MLQTFTGRRRSCLGDPFLGNAPEKMEGVAKVDIHPHELIMGRPPNHDVALDRAGMTAEDLSQQRKRASCGHRRATTE
jgi:hypothetical protein